MTIMRNSFRLTIKIEINAATFIFLISFAAKKETNERPISFYTLE